MKNRFVSFHRGLVTLYDKNKDEQFGGSLLFNNQPEPYTEDFSSKVDLEGSSTNWEQPQIYSSEDSMDYPEQNSQKPDTSSKSVIQEYVALIDFPLLFSFLHTKIGGYSKRLVAFLFYSEAKPQKVSSTTISIIENKVFDSFFERTFELVSEISSIFENLFRKRQLSLNWQFGKPHLTKGFFTSQTVLKSLAVGCLIVAFLSLSSILLPLSVATINSTIQKQNIEVKNEEPPMVDQREVIAQELEVDPSKDVVISNEYRLTIPKIGLESNISPNVDLENEQVYKQKLLETGVAHAKGSYFPGEPGSVFLFAHSTDTVFNIARFNAKFFLLSDLKEEDEIKVNYRGKEYTYVVSGKVIVEPAEVDLIRESGNALILMTCTPPGTDWQRLIIFADQKQPV